MKNAINVPLVRLFGIIALVAVIGFSMVACGGDDDNTGGNGGGGGGLPVTQESLQGTWKATFSANSWNQYVFSGNTYAFTRDNNGNTDGGHSGTFTIEVNALNTSVYEIHTSWDSGALFCKLTNATTISKGNVMATGDWIADTDFIKQ